MWTGEERRSETSAAARAAVTAKREAEALEAELAEEQDRRFPSKRRVKKLERELREIRAVERRCLEALGAEASPVSP